VKQGINELTLNDSKKFLMRLCPARQRLTLHGILVFGILMLLSGCKEVLYKEVSEQEANEMLEVLYSNNLDARKEYITNDSVTLYVDAKNFNKAISILKRQGYPKRKYKSVGDVFADSSLIPSALEEKAKYVYAIEESLAATISNLDGVLSSRVHIVYPERDNKNDLISEATASVFIKYNPNYELQGMTPKIKLLVSNAVNDLEYDKVSVTLFPSQQISEISLDSVSSPP
jgi:type III secretion protein J